MKLVPRLLVVTALGLLLPAAAPAQLFPGPWKVSTVDRPEQADPGFDDSGWRETPLHAVDPDGDILWLRARFDVPTSLVSPSRPLGVRFAGLATCEVHWDGVALERFGRVGATAADEVPGPVVWTAAVPERLTAPGSHVLALRCSAHHRGFRPAIGLWSLAVGEYGALTRIGSDVSRTALVSLSAMVIIGLYCLFLFLADRRDRSFLLLGLLCLTAGALLVAESWRSVVGYTYDWHLARLVTVTALSWLVAFELLVFLAERFPMSHRRLWVGLSVLVATGPIFYYRAWDPKSAVLLLIAFASALLWTARALHRRLPGSLLATTGTALAFGILLIEPLQILDQLFYVALDLLLVFLLAAHALQVRSTRRERAEALVRSTRLEAQLLKRSLQPHFLMNSLTALAEWFEEEPAVAAEMLEALSEELRLLGEIADRPLIPVADELRLCRAHLQVMSRRKGVGYRLTEDEVDGSARIPPAILHTLVENAITHHAGPASEESPVTVEMRLVQERAGPRRRLVFEAPLGEARGREAGNAQPRRDGTGLRYIQARLQEAYGKDWDFRSRREGSVWRTEITLP